MENRCTLPKSRRLRTPNDFRKVYQTRQYGNSAHHTFNARALETTDTNSPALGVTVSKKVSKHAVHRNRIKRQIREFYRLRQHQLDPAELVITAKASCAQADDEDRAQSLEVLWEKVLKWQNWHRRTQRS